MAASVHIYPLSRLVHASPAVWEQELKAIESGKTRAFSYYLPLREAAVLFSRSKGKKEEEIRSQLAARARAIPAPRGADPVKDNLAAFDVFVSKFAPRVAKFERSLLQADGDGGCPFGNVRLTGSPHFIATDNKGASRFAFLLASKWDEDALKAYLELLSVIIVERFNGSANSIWCMDLRSGQDFKWKSSSRIRARCEKTANLYARFIDAMSKSS